MDEIKRRGRLGRKVAPGGFSLVEMLVVVSIIIILAVVTLPAFNSIAIGSNINRAGQILSDQMALARLTATTKNRDVEVRIFKIPGAQQDIWGGVQLWIAEQTASGSTNIPFGRLVALPDNIVIDVSRSPLLNGISGSSPLPQYGSRDYCGFRFRANGSLGIGASGFDNYLTVIRDGAPDNFYTIQVNPVTGKTTVYRP